MLKKIYQPTTFVLSSRDYVYITTQPFVFISNSHLFPFLLTGGGEGGDGGGDGVVGGRGGEKGQMNKNPKASSTKERDIPPSVKGKALGNKQQKSPPFK